MTVYLPPHEDPNIGLGGNLGKTLNEFKSDLSKKFMTVEVLPVDYPADPATELLDSDGRQRYADGVSKGVDNLLTQFHSVYNRTCPIKSQIVMMGYSQGSLVVTTALSKLTPTEQKRVTAVLLYGDPYYRPRSSFAEGGVGVSGGNGVLQIARDAARLGLLPVAKVTKPLPNSLADKAYDYCYPLDPICQLPAGRDYVSRCFNFDPQCPHFLYANGPVEPKEWLESKIQKIQPDQPPSIYPFLLPLGHVGVAYSARLQPNGIWPPFNLSIVAGSLPDGLTMDSNGVIQGVPLRAQETVFTARITDAAGLQADSQFVVTVSA